MSAPDCRPALSRAGSWTCPSEARGQNLQSAVDRLLPRQRACAGAAAIGAAWAGQRRRDVHEADAAAGGILVFGAQQASDRARRCTDRCRHRARRRRECRVGAAAPRCGAPAGSRAGARPRRREWQRRWAGRRTHPALPRRHCARAARSRSHGRARKRRSAGRGRARSRPAGAARRRGPAAHSVGSTSRAKCTSGKSLGAARASSGSSRMVALTGTPGNGPKPVISTRRAGLARGVRRRAAGAS